MAHLLLLLRNNDMVLEVRDFKNNITDLDITGATGNVTLRRKNGQTVPGQTWPAAFTEAAAGLYRVTLVKGIDLKVGDEVLAEIDLDGGGAGLRYFARPTVRVTERKE